MATSPHAAKPSSSAALASSKTANTLPSARPNSLIRWVIGLLAGVAMFDLGVWWWAHRKAAESPATQSAELALGTFGFSRLNPRDGKLYEGQFDLTLRLSEGIDAEARQRAGRQLTHLQRAAEDVLQRLRAVDFTEPRLARLKDRLRDRLNDVLGSDAIEELIVDNFQIDRLNPAPGGSPAVKSFESTDKDE